MSIQYTADQLQRKFQGGSAGFARIAEVLREEGRLDEAVALCKNGLAEKPGSVTGHLVLGKCLVDLDRLEEAREAFEGVLRIDPRCLSAMHQLARIMARLQWPEAAAAYYRSILELEPWDTETLSRLRDIAPAGAHGLQGAPAPQAPSPAPSAFAPSAFAPPSSADESFTPAAPASGGVEEFDLNKVADFLPAESNPSDMAADLAGALQEVSLEDALSAPPPEARAVPSMPVAPAIAEPQPMDVLSAAAPAVDGEADAPAPISGDDVGERLDSLFGETDDKPILKAPSAPAGSPFPSASPMGPDSTGEPDADSRSADATIQLKAFEPDAPVEAVKATDTSVFSEGELIPVMAQPSLEPTAFAPPPTQETAAVQADTATGDDVAERLDDLFSAPGTGEMRVMSETAITEEPAAPEIPALEPPTSESPFAPATDLVLAADPIAPVDAPAGEVVTGDDVADKLEALFGAEPSPKLNPGRSDIELPSGTASWAAARPADEEPLGLESAPDETAISRASGIMPSADWNETLEGGQPPSSDIMSTESMLPRGIGRDSTPPITGNDIEDRLDSLFSLGDDASQSGAAARVPEMEIPEAPMPPSEALEVPFHPAAEEVAPEAPAAVPFSAGDSDRTVVMPAMRETASDWLARQGGDQAKDQAKPKDSGTLPRAAGGNDTLFMPTEEVFAPDEIPAAAAPSGTDTVGMEMVDGADIADRLDQIFAPEEEAAAAAKAAAEAAIARGEATVDGEATLPLRDEPSIETGEMPLDEVALFAQDPEAALPSPDLVMEPPTAETVVSGEDINNRLSQLFEEPDPQKADFAPVAGPRPLVEEEDRVEVFPAPLGSMDAGTPSPRALPGLEDEESAEVAPAAKEEEGMPSAQAASGLGLATATSLSPLQDEEEGALEEEENTPQSAAGANVATVTLAEIYFQQGLREQALQIYRQLLEREPGNDSVRKRIQEIEATKPDAGANPGADARRPRPGLKVPKRKK
jgi:tetratricopeptide (TPR) repeat protein